eukprot:6640705-Pyramimonas_sp.AAC.1
MKCRSILATDRSDTSAGQSREETGYLFRVRSPATNGALGAYVYRARSQVATCRVHYIHITCCEGLHPSTHRADKLAESHMC